MAEQMDIREIMDHLPHRYPFLLVDRVVDMELGKWIHAYKNVTFNEPYFTGHFPHHPVMPGVMIMEALAQAAGILAFKTAGEKPTKDSLFMFAGIDDARFKRQVLPGDQLHLHVEIERWMRNVLKLKAEARVDGELAAEARLICAKKDV